MNNLLFAIWLKTDWSVDCPQRPSPSAIRLYPSIEQFSTRSGLASDQTDIAKWVNKREAFEWIKYEAPQPNGTHCTNHDSMPDSVTECAIRRKFNRMMPNRKSRKVRANAKMKIEQELRAIDVVRLAGHLHIISFRCNRYWTRTCNSAQTRPGPTQVTQQLVALTKNKEKKWTRQDWSVKKNAIKSFMPMHFNSCCLSLLTSCCQRLCVSVSGHRNERRKKKEKKFGQNLIIIVVVGG